MYYESTYLKEVCGLDRVDLIRGLGQCTFVSQ